MASPGQADLEGNRYGHLPYRRRVINYSTGSTATFQLTPDESGAIFNVPTVSTVHFSLPKISSLALGLNYEFFFSTMAAVADYNIVSTVDSSANIVMMAATSAASTVSAITPLVAVLGQRYHIKLTAISSVIWLAEYDTGVSSADTSNLTSVDNVLGHWGVGTTQ